MKTAQRLAFATCAATLVLIAVGVWVRASGSGLGCPDWPLCHGGVVPPGDQGHQPVVEYSHRFVASLVGLLVIATAIFAWKYFAHAPIVRWSAAVTVPLVGIQGVLGAITVWRELPPEVVATHLLTAMLILSLETLTAFGMLAADPTRAGSAASPRIAPGTGRMALAGLAYFAVLLWVGGYLTESGASTACDGWPLCNGGVLPSSDSHEIVHMLHRYLAAGFGFVAVPLALQLWRQRSRWMLTAPLALGLGGLYAAQVLVGALNVWYTFPDHLTISHTVIASLLWFGFSVVSAVALYQPQAAPRTTYRARVTA